MPQLSDVNAFIERSQVLSTPLELDGLVRDITNEMGFDHFAMVHHVNLKPMNQQLTHMSEGTLVALTDYPPAWVEEYVARNFVENDYIHLASHQTSIGFQWSDVPKLIKMTSAHRQMYDDTLRAGIGEGYSVPINVPGQPRGSSSFTNRRGRALPVQNLAMAFLIGSFAFHAAQRMVINARREPIIPRKGLSPRQVECLFFVGRGKTDWEIGKILGISRETVKLHLKAARDLYGVVDRTQAVLCAIYDGEFTVNDMLRTRRGGTANRVN